MVIERKKKCMHKRRKNKKGEKPGFQTVTLMTGKTTRWALQKTRD
jgi:hypothetical protein